MPESAIPAQIIGAEAVEALHTAGYRIVPTVPTMAMRRAAASAMALRKVGLGAAWFYVSNVDKAALRWTAMLDAWHRDREGLKSYQKPAPEADIPERWSWSLGRFFRIAAGWEHRKTDG